MTDSPIDDPHDTAVDPGEAARDQHEREVEQILLDAEERDEAAAERDAAADRRDMAANLDAFIRGIDDQDAYEARLLAARDRKQAHGDRAASKLDRYRLSGRSPNWAERQAEMFGPVGEDHSSPY